jgi:HAD superfamily hydrolase (TIGR01509 family)
VDILVGELQGLIDQVHHTNSAEFTLARWLAENREHFAEQGSILELEHAVWHATARLELMPGVREALLTFGEASLGLGCISNAIFSGPVLRSELERHGLGEHFGFVISSADLKIRKPDPRIFSAGLSQLGLPASSVWFVGDSWATDVQGAAASGLFPVWLSANEEPAPRKASWPRAASWSEICSLVADSLAA